MAEGMRMDSMEENLRKLQSIVQQHSAAIEQWVSSSNSGLEETCRQIGDHSRQMSDLQSKIEENRERMEDHHKKPDEKMENFHKNTAQRLENLSEMMRNVSRDREQELPATGNRVNLGKNSLGSGSNSAQRAAGFQVPTPDRGIPGSSTPNLGNLGNHSKDFHRDFIDRSMSSCGDSVTKVDGDRQILYLSSMEDSCPSKSEDDLSEIDATIDTSIHEILLGRFVHVEKQSLLNAHHMFDEMPKGKVEVFQPLKVISNSSLEIVAFEIESEELGDDSMAFTEIRWDDFKINSLELDIPIAYKVLDELPENKIGLFVPCVEFKKHSDLKWKFCTGISNLNSANKDPIGRVCRGKAMNLVDSCSFVFDPGKATDGHLLNFVELLLVNCLVKCYLRERVAESVLVHVVQLLLNFCAIYAEILGALLLKLVGLLLLNLLLWASVELRVS